MTHYGNRAKVKRSPAILAEPTKSLVEIKKMMSERSYQELQDKVKELVREKNFDFIFPGVVQALVHGSGEERERILNGWLDMDTCRVCSTCGKIMSEGWYLNDAGYACSDECAAKSEGISMEEFEKYQIYKDDIIEYLQCVGDTRSIEELSNEELTKIKDTLLENTDYFWTEWY